MNWKLSSGFLSAHGIFWWSVVIGMILLLVIVRSLSGNELEGMAGFYMIPFVIAGPIVYRNNLLETLLTNFVIYLYAFFILFLEEMLFGGAGYGFFFLVDLGPFLLIFSILAPFMARLAMKDRLSGFLIVGGLLAGLFGSVAYNLLQAYLFYQTNPGIGFTLQDDLLEWILELNNFSFIFVGGVIGFLIAKILPVLYIKKT